MTKSASGKRRWTKKHDKMVDDAERLFQTNTQGEEIDI
jgi:hypothetical protein